MLMPGLNGTEKKQVQPQSCTQTVSTVTPLASNATYFLNSNRHPCLARLSQHLKEGGGDSRQTELARVEFSDAAYPPKIG